MAAAKGPSGICTQLYRCRACGTEMYQAPRAVVEHFCKVAREVVELKPERKP